MQPSRRRKPGAWRPAWRSTTRPSTGAGSTWRNWNAVCSPGSVYPSGSPTTRRWQRRSPRGPRAETPRSTPLTGSSRPMTPAPGYVGSIRHITRDTPLERSSSLSTQCQPNPRRTGPDGDGPVTGCGDQPATSPWGAGCRCPAPRPQPVARGRHCLGHY